MTVYSIESNTVTSIGHIVLIFNFKTVYLFHIWCEARVLIPWLLFWHSDNKSSTFEFDIQPNTAFEIIQRLIGLLSSYFISFCVFSEHQNAFNHSLRSFDEFNNSIGQTCWLAVLSLCRWGFCQDMINQPQSNLVSKLQFQIGLVS